MGEISISKSSKYIDRSNHSRLSPYLQSLVTLLGCNMVFDAVPSMLETLVGVSPSDSTVWRVCNQVARQIDDQQVAAPSPVLADALCDADKTVYGMVDASMVFTDERWKEVKLGRVMVVESEQGADGKYTWQVQHSQYVGTMEDSDYFQPIFEAALPKGSACKIVFVVDGATWMRVWITANYPDAVQILDFFHAIEKLAEVARHTPDPGEWLDTQRDRLLENGVDEVYNSIQTLGMPEKEKGEILGYIDNNRQRMRYKDYREQGLMIGSGHIEAAHRTVLQARMKLSGQRWSMDGGANMVKLRTIYKSGKTELVTNTFRKSA